MRINCGEIRLRLQESPLVRTGQQDLDAHLAACPDCRQLAVEWEWMDALILGSLEGMTAGRSVRAGVRRRIAAPRRRHLLTLPPWKIPHPALWPLPVAAVLALLLLVFLPRTNSPGVPPPPPVSAAWSVQRPNVGFLIAADPADGDHLLAGAFGQVYVSWNGGDTWRRLASPGRHLTIRAVLIARGDARRYLVASQHSVYLSTDGGAHWRPAVTGLPGATIMFLKSGFRPGTFYVGPGIVWSGAAGGSIWQRTGRDYVFAPDGVQTLAVAPDGTLYAGIWAGGVATSDDGGRTWHRRSSGLAPDVMDVAIQGSRLWAGTTHGIYRSDNAGAQWRYVGPGFHLAVTSILPVGQSILAGGRGALVRSDDGGRTWTLSMDGLPVNPYIAALQADPSRPTRLYASVNGDGLYRSDDGGRTWQPIDRGLPMHGSDSAPPLILFLRGHVLWKTDTAATDPGVLTVETDVQRAVLAPDGASAAYVAASGAGWAVRILCSGGCAPRTVLTGTGPAPTRLLWSPNASLLAMVRPGSLTVTNRTQTRSFPLAAGERVLRWSPDMRSLLLWRAGAIIRQPWDGTETIIGHSAQAPSLAPDGIHLAALTHGELRLGTIRGSAAATRLVTACRLRSWSPDGSRLLAQCGTRTLVLSGSGRVMAAVSGYRDALWGPGGAAVLLYRDGGLWRWSPGSRPVLLLPDAAPAS
ncbi:MAG TPA: hypothetical protein VFB58_13515 [Chloroflexota bacterium]|nr:hypothetical protein [Chloroflexota bacterium]